MSDMIYIKLSKSVEVLNSTFTLGDICDMKCTDASIENKAKTIKIGKVIEGSHSRVVISIMDIITTLQKEFNNLEVINVGEPDIVVQLSNQKKKKKYLQIIKLFFVSLIIFFGSAFVIMTFNNDITIEGLFSDLYREMTGKVSDGFTVLEISYSIGIAVGITVFYNHLGYKKLSKDPTPIEVQMRIYEEDINKTLVENSERGGPE